ncbi:MAG: 2-hydroxychromene-2-carboxylate isomerase [Polyangiaceae bacterium]
MKTVEFYFDYASPWSYLATELIQRRLGGVEIVYRPIYLRGLESFKNGVPYVGAKLAYIARDLIRCAAHEQIQLEPPAAFPLDGLHALRAAIVALDRGCFEAFHKPMFRAAWVERREITKELAVEKLAAALEGAPEADVLAAMTGAKERLRELTDEAVKRGVFGVPAFVVGDELFWGHDRMDYVAREAAAAS